MGNISQNSSDQSEDSNNSLRIAIDLKKKVEPQLKQLLNWSLGEIREIYAPFRKRKSSPLLNRSEFLRFIRLSRMTSFYIYDHICKASEPINAFEVMAILILTSYTTYTYKLQFLMNVFDLVSLKTIQFSELILMFKSVIRGYCFLTNQKSPDNNVLEKYAQNMYSKADMNNDQNLELVEILDWFNGNTEAIQLFNRFEPKFYGKEEFYIFNNFVPYTEDEIQTLFFRVNKVYKKEKLCDEDYSLLKVGRKSFGNSVSNEGLFMQGLENKDVRASNLSPKFTKNTNFRQLAKDNKSFVNFYNECSSKQIFEEKEVKEIDYISNQHISANQSSKKENKEDNASKNRSTAKNISGLFSNLANCASNGNISSKTIHNLNSNAQNQKTLNRILGQSQIKNTGVQQSQSLHNSNMLINSSAIHVNSKETNKETNNLAQSSINLKKGKYTKKKFENIIIIKGKAITKKEVFDLREYFDKISGGKKIMLIEDFINSFSQEKYNHMKGVAASLYNFLDKNQTGKVTFYDLVFKLYTNLTPKHIQIIKSWCIDYNKNFNIQKKMKQNRNHEDLKKRILPKSCMARYREIFSLFDKDKKGYVLYEDMKRILEQVCTEKQMMDLFSESDKDQDGKLTIQEFVHVLLPPDLDIEGLN